MGPENLSKADSKLWTTCFPHCCCVNHGLFQIWKLINSSKHLEIGVRISICFEKVSAMSCRRRLGRPIRGWKSRAPSTLPKRCYPKWGGNYAVTTEHCVTGMASSLWSWQGQCQACWRVARDGRLWRPIEIMNYEAWNYERFRRCRNFWSRAHVSPSTCRM
jgi:hypothetical protein